MVVIKQPKDDERGTIGNFFNISSN